MSDKKAQVLVLDPPVDLVFKGPFTEVVTSQLTLQNPSNEQVIFKVKTTAPKQYCVRPNSGLLKPQEMATISVMLQPFEHSSADKSKHKFMVQTMFAPSGFKVESLDAVWKEANKSQLMDSKLRCVFLDEGDDAGSGGGNTTQTQAPVTDSTTNGGSISSGIKVDAPTTPKQEEEEQLAPPASDSSVASGNTAGSNFQSNAGSTPAHVGPVAKEVEKATVESKVRMLQDKIDQLSSENSQLKPQATDDVGTETLQVQGTPTKIIQKAWTTTRSDEFDEGGAEDKIEKRDFRQDQDETSTGLRYRGREEDSGTQLALSGGRRAAASGKSKPIILLIVVLLLVVILFAAIFFLR